MRVFVSKKETFLCTLFLMIFSFAGLGYAHNGFSFTGELDFLNKRLEISSADSGQSLVKVKIEEASKDDYLLHLKFNRLKTFFFDLSSDITVQAQRVSSQNASEKVIHGKLSSQYSLVNYRPVEELSGEFEIRDNKIFLKAVSFGKILCSGSIDMAFPYAFDLMLGLSSLDMVSFLSFWMEEDPDASGTVSGDIKVTGSLEEIFLQGKLTSYEGHVEGLKFNKFLLNIQGIYPDLEILESFVAQSEGMSFVFQGPMSLREESDFKKQVKALHVSPLVKDSGSHVEWTLKSSDKKEMGTVELKYLLRKSLDGKDTEGRDMLGIENIFEF